METFFENILNYIITFFETNLDYNLFGLILLTGIFITKYTSNIKIANRYKVLFSSIIISIIMYILEDCNKTCLNKYLFTYFFTTSFYELFVALVINKLKLFVKLIMNKLKPTLNK